MNVKMYNSWRMAYFLYIFIIYFAIYAIYILNIIAKRKKIKFKNKISLMLITVFVLFSCYRIYLYHPYQSFYFNILAKKNIKDTLDVDYTGLSGLHFLKEITYLEKDKNKIYIGVASWYPLWRMTELLDKKDQDRIIILSNEDRYKSDYIYSNRISDVDKKIYKKYNIPKNFKKIKEHLVDGAIIYEVYKRIE